MVRALIDTAAAPGRDRGRVAAGAAAGIGPARARPVLPGPVEADRPGARLVVVVAAVGVGPAAVERVSAWAQPAADIAGVADRRRRRCRCVLPTTGDVGASLADSATAAAGRDRRAAGVVRRQVPGDGPLRGRRLAPHVAMLSLAGLAHDRLGLLRVASAGAVLPGDRDHTAMMREADAPPRVAADRRRRPAARGRGCGAPFAGRSTSISIRPPSAA